ncbi:hypothetical protein V2J09_021344 [Rumex salicifolius]
MGSSSIVLVYGLVALWLLASVSRAQDLDYGYYDKDCSEFEAIVSRKVKQWHNKDPTILPSLIRLHFHDCAVRGCDGSILLDIPGSERTSPASKTLRGFEVIDDIKAALEKKCEKTVSCADILTAAARDATYILKGPFWANKYGRTDGIHSYAFEADKIPRGLENMTYLIEFFQSKGLNLYDLVVLSGSHTIGRSSCESVQPRLFNFKGTGKADPSINLDYLNFLRRKCRNATAYVELDPTPNTTFDNAYYTNLNKHMGLLYTDQLLESDSRTRDIVDTMSTQPSVFYSMFSSSMVKLGEIVDEDDEGQVRLVCSKPNY